MKHVAGLAAVLAAGYVGLHAVAYGQGGCTTGTTEPKNPAATAFAEGRTGDAETLYREALQQQPGDAGLTAGLMRALLRQGKLTQAASVADEAHADTSHSALLLTELGELQIHEGRPWEARKSLQSASAVDACYARAHYLLSRVDRVDAMYASERREIETAHSLDPEDPDIKHMWRTVNTPAKDVEGIADYLASTPNLDAASRKASEEYAASMRPQLLETTQSCRGLPTVERATLPMPASMRDGKQVDAYRLDVSIGQSRVKMIVDTAASGLYISRVLATEAQLEPGQGDPPGTVRAPDVTIGSLVFHDCLVGVSDKPFPDKGDGFIGTDLFSDYLITLNQPEAKLSLEPLPKEKGIVPLDRSDAIEADAALREWSPVYHKAQYLLVPVELNGRERQMFVLDTGIRFSTIAQGVADEASLSRKSATSPLQTTSGASIQVYRSGFDYAFSGLLLRHQDHIVSLGTDTLERKLGMQIGGLLGFDLLHTMTIHLDYRDGLVKFDPSTAGEVVSTPVVEVARDAAPKQAPEQAACPPMGITTVDAGMTVAAKTTGMWEASHMKPGQTITLALEQQVTLPHCFLPSGALLYGRVTESSGKAGHGQIGLKLDQGVCLGKGKQPLPLKIVSVVAPPGQAKGLHDAIPTSIGGGSGRSITEATGALIGAGDDVELADRRGPRTVQVGSVVGLPKLTLDVSGGPGCSAAVSNTEQGLRLGEGTRFVMMLMAPTP